MLKKTLSAEQSAIHIGYLLGVISSYNKVDVTKIGP
jgi:hypothetical protein